MNRIFSSLLFISILASNSSLIYSSQQDVDYLKGLVKYQGDFPGLSKLTLNNAKEQLKDIGVIKNQSLRNGENILENVVGLKDYQSATPVGNLKQIQGDLRAVKALINLGVDINIRDQNLTTPLMMAAFTGQDGIVEYLLSKGADKSLQNSGDHDYKTALDYAMESQEKYKDDPVISAKLQKIVRMLLSDSKPDMSETKRGAEFVSTPTESENQLQAIQQNLKKLNADAKILLEKPKGPFNKATINNLLSNINNLDLRIRSGKTDTTSVKNYTDELNRLIDSYNSLNLSINGPSTPSSTVATNQNDIKRGVEFVSTPTPSSETQGNLRDQLRDLRDNDLLTYLQPKVLGLKEKLRGEKKGFDAVIDLLSKIDRLETFITYRLTSRIPLISIDTQKLAISELNADYNDLLFTYTGEGNDPILNKLNLLKSIADNLKSRPKYTEFKTQVDQFSDAVDKLLSNAKNMKRNELEGKIGSLEVAQWHLYELFGKEFETASK